MVLERMIHGIQRVTPFYLRVRQSQRSAFGKGDNLSEALAEVELDQPGAGN